MKNKLDKQTKKSLKSVVISNLKYLSLFVDARSYADYQHLKTDSEILSVINSDAFLEAIKKKKIDKSSLLDYMPSYTRSIVSLPSGSIQKNAMDLKLLNAMEQADKFTRRDKERKQYVRWMLEGISKLEAAEMKLILDKYIFQLPNKVIEERNSISSRNLSRKLDQAYINLAIIWDLTTVPIPLELKQHL